MPTPEWLDEDEGEAHAHRRRTWLIGAAIAPWLLVVGILVIGAGQQGSTATVVTPTAGVSSTPANGATEEPESPEASHHPGTAEPAPQATPGVDVPAPSPTDEPQEQTPPTAPDSAIDVTPLVVADDVPPEAAALAVVVARTWLGDEPVAHLVTESVRRVSAESMVASVLAVIDTGEWSSSIRRLAVPLADAGGGVAPTATPYMLPPPTLESVDARLHPAGDTRLVARVAEAIHVAGLTDLDVKDVYTAEGWPLLADVRGPDGGERPAIWLTIEDGVPVVAGAVRAGVRTGSLPNGPTPTEDVAEGGA